MKQYENARRSSGVIEFKRPATLEDQSLANYHQLNNNILEKILLGYIDATGTGIMIRLIQLKKRAVIVRINIIHLGNPRYLHCDVI